MLEQQQDKHLEEFDIQATEYPQTTYWGRVMNLMNIQNPLNFFVPHSRIQAAKELYDEELKKSKQANGQTLMYTHDKVREIRKAQHLVHSSVHPDTGEYVPRLFRLSSFAAMNVPIIFGMII